MLSTGLQVTIGLVPLAGSVGTFVLAFLAKRQLDEVRRQIDVNQKALTAAFDSSKSAEQSAREMHRARANEVGPQLLLWFTSVQPLPLLDDTRSVVQGGQLSLLEADNSRQVAEGEEFSDPGDREKILWYLARGAIVNEGKGTARIRIDAASRFVAGVQGSLDPDTGLRLTEPTQLGKSWFSQYLLRPGEAAVFEWAAGRSIGEWIDAGTGPLAHDKRRIGFDAAATSVDVAISDFLFAELVVDPLVPSAANASSWTVKRLTDEEAFVGSYPPERIYRAEGTAIPNPPWRAN